MSVIAFDTVREFLEYQKRKAAEKPLSVPVVLERSVALPVRHTRGGKMEHYSITQKQVLRDVVEKYRTHELSRAEVSNIARDFGRAFSVIRQQVSALKIKLYGAYPHGGLKKMSAQTLIVRHPRKILSADQNKINLARKSTTEKDGAASITVLLDNAAENKSVITKNDLFIATGIGFPDNEAWEEYCRHLCALYPRARMRKDNDEWVLYV